MFCAFPNFCNHSSKKNYTYIYLFVYIRKILERWFWTLRNSAPRSEHHDFVFDSARIWYREKKSRTTRYYDKSSRKAKGKRRNFHTKFVHVARGDYDVADGISRYRYHDDGNARARARAQLQYCAGYESKFRGRECTRRWTPERSRAPHVCITVEIYRHTRAHSAYDVIIQLVRIETMHFPDRCVSQT